MIIILTVILVAIFSYKILSYKKINWHESFDENQYEVTFSYFNGKKNIPISVEKGQLIVLNYVWDFDDGRIGISIIDPKGHDLDTRSKQFKAEQSGLYTVIISGNKATNGRLELNWELK
jgi:hypothetical protein